MLGGILVLLLAWGAAWILKLTMVSWLLGLVFTYGAFAAATVLGSVPLLALLLLFQRQIVAGITQGAIKG